MIDHCTPYTNGQVGLKKGMIKLFVKGFGNEIFLESWNMGWEIMTNAERLDQGMNNLLLKCQLGFKTTIILSEILKFISCNYHDLYYIIVQLCRLTSAH